MNHLTNVHRLQMHNDWAKHTSPLTSPSNGLDRLDRERCVTNVTDHHRYRFRFSNFSFAKYNSDESIPVQKDNCVDKRAVLPLFLTTLPHGFCLTVRGVITYRLYIYLPHAIGCFRSRHCLFSAPIGIAALE